MSGKSHHTFNGIHTKYRPPLNSDHPLLNNSQQNGGTFHDHHTQSREHVTLPHRRAMSVEPTSTQIQTSTVDRRRPDAHRDKRNVSGDRHRRGVSVDRNAIHDTTLDRKREKSTDRTRSEMNLHRRRDISVERGNKREPSLDRSISTGSALPPNPATVGGEGVINVSALVGRIEPSVDRLSAPVAQIQLLDDDNDSDSDNEAGNYVRLTQPLNPPMGRQASRQTSSESNSSVFERNTTPRNSNTSRGRPSFTVTTSPGYSRVNYGEASPHYSPMHHGSQQQLYVAQQQQQHHHTSPLPNRNNSPNSLNFNSSSGEANDYVNVNWKPSDEPPEESPPPRPPRPTRLDIKHQPNCNSPAAAGPPRTQPRLSRSQAGTPQSTDDMMRSRFSPGGSPPPPMHHQKLTVLNVDEKKSVTDSRKPSLPPKPCPGPHHTGLPSTPGSGSADYP